MIRVATNVTNARAQAAEAIVIKTLQDNEKAQSILVKASQDLNSLVTKVKATRRRLPKLRPRSLKPSTPLRPSGRRSSKWQRSGQLRSTTPQPSTTRPQRSLFLTRTQRRWPTAKPMYRLYSWTSISTISITMTKLHQSRRVPRQLRSQRLLKLQSHTQLLLPWLSRRLPHSSMSIYAFMAFFLLHFVSPIGHVTEQVLWLDESTIFVIAVKTTFSSYVCVVLVHFLFVLQSGTQLGFE